MASWNGLTGFEFTAKEKECIHNSFINIVFNGDLKAYEKWKEKEERDEAIAILIGYGIISLITVVCLLLR